MGLQGKDWAGEKCHMRLGEEQGRKYGRHFGEHHLFTSVVFEAVYIAASVAVQGSETDACNKKRVTRPKWQSPFYRHHQKFSFLAQIQDFLRQPVQVTRTAVLRRSKVKQLIQMKFKKKTTFFSTYLLSYLLLPAG